MRREAIEALLASFAQAAAVSEILNASASGDNNLVVLNLRGGAPAALAAAMALAEGKPARAGDPPSPGDSGQAAAGPTRKVAAPILLITSNLERAEALADGIAFFGAEPQLFPAFETLPFEAAEPALHIASARNRVLAGLAGANRAAATPAGHANRGERSGAPFIVAPADSLMHRILPAAELKKTILAIKWAERHDLDDLARDLVALGYERESMVESPGEFSVRGTILDVYPIDAERPWRLDFFGEELESIRPFDPATQRSLSRNDDIEQIEILARRCIGPGLESLAAGRELATVFDLFPESTRVIVDGPARVAERVEFFGQVAARNWEEIHAPGHEDAPEIFKRGGVRRERWIVSPEEFSKGLARFGRMEWPDLSVEAEGAAAKNARIVSVGAQSFAGVPSNFKTYLELIEEKQLEGYRVAIVCDNAGQAQRLDEMLGEHSISAVRPDGAPAAKAERPAPAHAPRPEAADVALLIGDLHEGFIFPAGKLLILTDREMFGRYKRRRTYRKAYAGPAIADPTEIQRGDYVVHVDHGIGQYERVRRQQVDDRTCEFLEISYQEGDKLLVPVEKLNLIQKYASADGKEPALDRLGQKRWARRRKKTQEAVRKLAGELLKLYAEREAADREPYGPDTVWQQEFEASFVYQETPDQLKAIRDVKADFQRRRPTDRLICGDVGYGKTEVAIRAAFKALCDGRQVAVLAPTTILAQQHYETFKERLASFPFRAEVVSRFRSPAETKEALDGLAKGEVNLIIGTHRLLSKDVRFQNLGLLVVDEEQRFGVKQKERIKGMKTAVDVLTLTATPIPRTLHLALSKLRDLSIIQTPPADRLPIKTRTIHFDKELIEEAILRELNRGGQVYFVHNRIATIDDVARTIQEIVPRARIAVGHGQMDEEALEGIMIDFIEGKQDILVSTTIIENGIDIPNVNTIIINRADAFGLAQLYQLRGRVGRDVRQAYAYLILPQGQPITDAATKRLSALEEFTELGMGFSIAMRDMEIRGTGNILGGEQSGAISDVGFDLYCKLLEEAVLDLKGERPMDELYPTEVKWPVDQWLPEEYVPIESQRIRFYKDLASAHEGAKIDEIRDELTDRYGPLPPEAVNLMNAFLVKLALAPWKAETVKGGIPGAIRITCRDRARELAEELSRLQARAGWIDRVSVRADGVVTIYLSSGAGGVGRGDENDDDTGEMGKTEENAEILKDLAEVLRGLGVP